MIINQHCELAVNTRGDRVKSMKNIDNDDIRAATGSTSSISNE